MNDEVDLPKIESLPADLIATFPARSRDWLAVGVSRKPTEKLEATLGANSAYEQAGFNIPRVAWAASPMEGLLMATLAGEFHVVARLLNEGVKEQSVLLQVHADAWSNAWKDCIDAVEEKLYNEVRDEVSAPIFNVTGAPLKDQIVAEMNAILGVDTDDADETDEASAAAWDDIREKLTGRAFDALTLGFPEEDREVVREIVIEELSLIKNADLKERIWKGMDIVAHGQHSSEWLAFFECFEDIVPSTQKLRPIARIAKASGWWWPFKNIVVLSERPLELHRDAISRLHGEDGPALLYKDGFAIFAWHGLRIPRWYIEEKELITTKAILDQENAELRRVMTEIYGFDRVIKDMNGVKVGEDEELGLKRELYDVNLGNRQTLRIVRVNNGTLEEDGRRREFFLGMPTDARTPKEAVAWSYGINPDLYEENVRT